MDTGGFYDVVVEFAPFAFGDKGSHRRGIRIMDNVGCQAINKGYGAMSLFMRRVIPYSTNLHAKKWRIRKELHDYRRPTRALESKVPLADHRQLIVFQNSRLEAVDWVLPAPGSLPKIQPFNKFRN